MKKVICLCAVLSLLCGCTAAESGRPEVPAQVTPVESGDMPIDNPAPIPGLKDLVFDDVASVLTWTAQAAGNKMYPLSGKEQEEAVLNRLKQVQLSGKPDGKVKLVPTLKYDVRLKNGETVHIGFAGLYVDFGDGAYLYENCDKSVYPRDIRQITFDNGDRQYSYEDEGDIDALMGSLTTTPWTESAEFKGDGVLLSFSILPRGAPLEESYVIEIADVPICLYKSFFTLKTYLGLIGIDGFNQLKIAQNGQFGTRLHFTAASGGRTIYPAGHFVSSSTYSEEAGGLLCADAFPRFEDQRELPEELTLAEDFSVWMKKADRTWYKLSRGGQKVKEGGYLTYSEFDGLEAGMYQVEIYVSTRGRYIENLKEYESYTDVYYFVLRVE